MKSLLMGVRARTHYCYLPMPFDNRANLELEVPSYGEYKLFMSYLKGPEGGVFDIFQRQIPVNRDVNGYSPEVMNMVQKEYMGNITIEEKTNTITLIFKNSPEGAENGKLYLNKIFWNLNPNRE